MPGVIAFEYDGDTVYIDDTNAYISATPHTARGPLSTIEVEFESKLTTVDATAAFLFTDDYNKPSRIDRQHFWNETITYDNGTSAIIEHEWQTISMSIDKYNIDYDGNNRVFLKSGINLVAGQRYKYRLWITSPKLPPGTTQEEAFPDYQGKWGIAFFPSSYGLNYQAAINDNKFFYLDPTIELTEGLLAYYTMDADKLGVDETGNYTSTDFSGLTNSTGIINGAHASDGNTDYVRLPTGLRDGIQGTNSFTISTWINRTGAEDNFYLSSWGEGSKGVYLATVAGKARAGRSACTHSEGLTTITVGEYFHVLSTYDSLNNNLSIYINGVMEDSDACTATDTSTNDLFIGGADDFLMDGSIDEVAFWNIPLNQTEITALYNNGSGCPYPLSCGDAPPAPVVTLDSPANNVTITDFANNFSFTTTNFSSSQDCLLLIDGLQKDSVNVADGSFSMSNATYLESINLDNLTHYWSVSCEEANSTSRNFTVYYVAPPTPLNPVVTLISPANNATLTSYSTLFAFGAVNLSYDNVCLLLIDGAEKNWGVFGNGTGALLNISYLESINFDALYHNWSISCQEANSTTTRSFTVEYTPPPEPNFNHFSVSIMGVLVMIMTFVILFAAVAPNAELTRKAMYFAAFMGILLMVAVLLGAIF